MSVLSPSEILEDRDQSDFASFFQLTGIHGLPFIEWAKAKPSQLHPYRGNYCTHGNVLFPTWHRAYESIWEVLRTLFLIQISGD